MQQQQTIEQFLASTCTVALADGRSLAYLDLGDSAGKPNFFFHGLPGSRIEAIALHESAKQHGYRLIAPDRPGIGGSAPQPGRRLLDWPADVAALADTLGIDTFGVIGVSGGGLFALACANAMPERLTFVVDVSGSAPLYTDTIARHGLSGVDRLFARLGQYLPATLLRLPFACMAYRLRKMETGHQFVKLFGRAISAPDRQIALQDASGRFLIRDAQEAFRQGTRAVAEETLLNYQAWGFALGDIAIPVHLFHGTEDKLVPFSFGEFKARHLPQARFNRLPGKGHFHLLLHPDELFAYLTR